MCWVSKCFYQHDIWKAEDRRITSCGLGKHHLQWSQGPLSLYVLGARMQLGHKSHYVPLKYLESCCISSLLLWSPSPNPVSTWILDWLPSKIHSRNPLFWMLLPALTLPVSAKVPGCLQGQALLGRGAPGKLDNFPVLQRERELFTQNFLIFRNRWIHKNWINRFTKIKSTMHSLETFMFFCSLLRSCCLHALGHLCISSNAILKINKISFLRQKTLFSRGRVNKFITSQWGLILGVN